MLWFIIGGMIGVLFLKQKYGLSFWKAVWYGIMTILGVYFAISALLGIFTIFSGVEDPSPTLLYVLFYSFLAFGGFSYILRLRKNNQVVPESESGIQPTANVSTNLNELNNYSAGDIVETSLAGVTFEGRQRILRWVEQGQSVVIEREPRNPHDSNAIKVLYPPQRNKTIGYIPRDIAARIAWIIDRYQDRPIIGHIISVYKLKNESPLYGVRISFRLPDKYLEEIDYTDYPDSDLEGMPF